MTLEDMDVGASTKGAVTVKPEHFASGIVAGTPDVFSTPALGALVEKTAAEWVENYLDDSEMTVGTQLVINHTGATPERMTVRVTLTLAGRDGRRLDFEWRAEDDSEEVGHGTHQRFVLDRARFLERLATKKT
jgi:fluoroacetyl-CoA thioesterase